MPRLLLDANMPIGLRAALPNPEVLTAFEMGWGALGNGILLAAAEGAGFDAMITGDSNIQYQQNLAGRKLALIVLNTNHWPTIEANVNLVVAAIERIAPGNYEAIVLPKPPLRRRLRVKPGRPS